MPVSRLQCCSPRKSRVGKASDSLPRYLSTERLEYARSLVTIDSPVLEEEIELYESRRGYAPLALLHLDKRSQAGPVQTVLRIEHPLQEVSLQNWQSCSDILICDSQTIFMPGEPA